MRELRDGRRATEKPRHLAHHVHCGPSPQGLTLKALTSMAIREFTDSAGARWAVWGVVPSVATNSSYRGPERRTVAAEDPIIERRRPAPGPVPLLGGLERGWLCFESKGEKRRLSPAPQDWETCSDEMLARYCQSAQPAPLPPRSLPRL